MMAQEYVLETETRALDFENIKLRDIIDIPVLQEMMDDFYDFIGLTTAILDVNGEVLVHSGWQDICVKFHRVQPESCLFCLESDTLLSSGVAPGTFKVYRCKNNLWDMATPIMLSDKHIGNIFMGQFLYDDEEPDYALFRAQAKRFGYDESAYIDALGRVPRFSRKTVDSGMRFISKLAQVISKANYSNVLLTYTLARREQAQEEIHQLNADLERRVIERTDQLKAAYQEMESFAYSVSHDLRAPLRSIDGFSLALLEDYEDKLDEVGKNYLHRVRTATQRMAQLIDDILKLSRISRNELAFEKVNLSALVAEIAEELHSKEPERNVTFVIEKDVTTTGDTRLLKVVLDNLIGNAWKFTSAHAEARIEFGFLNVEGQVAYFVRDDGAGFDMNYADKLFITFQRLHTEQEFPGTGIGLALVQHIIHRHCGTVWAEGAVEQGAKFWFTLGVDDND